MHHNGTSLVCQGSLWANDCFVVSCTPLASGFGLVQSLTGMDLRRCVMPIETPVESPGLWIDISIESAVRQ